MSEPAAFALIKEGKPRIFADRWASAFLRRELLWGPDDFAAWVEQFEEIDDWDGDCSGGAAVDLDRREVYWLPDEQYPVPRVRRAYETLLAAAWPGFKVAAVPDALTLAKKMGVVVDAESAPDDDQDDYEPRPERVKDARRYQDLEDDDEQDEDDEPCAWVTVLDKSGTARHRLLEQLSLDLLRGESAAFRAALKLKPAEIPREAAVTEGLFIHVDDRTAFVWGSPELLAKMTVLGKQWKGWTLRWTKRGYPHQCEAAGVAGRLMSDVDALAEILPLALSTEQFSLGAIMGAAGKGLMKWGWRITLFLIALLSLPLVAFGLFSGAWTSVLYAIGATAAVIVGGFLLIVRRVRRAFNRDMLRDATDDRQVHCAGPQDPQQRRTRLAALLAKCGYSAWEEVEPHFDEDLLDGGVVRDSVQHQVAELTALSGFYTEQVSTDSDTAVLHGFADWLDYAKIDRADVPTEVAEAWAPLEGQLRELGFQELRFVRPHNIGLKLSYVATFYEEQGDCVATLSWLRLPGEEGWVETVFAELNTYCDKDADIVTGMVEMQFMEVSDVVKIHGVEIENHSILKPVAEVYARHRERCSGRSVEPVEARSVAELFDGRSRRRFDQLLEGGAIRELRQVEVDVIHSYDASEYAPA